MKREINKMMMNREFCGLALTGILIKIQGWAELDRDCGGDFWYKQRLRVGLRISI